MARIAKRRAAKRSFFLVLVLSIVCTFAVYGIPTASLAQETDSKGIAETQDPLVVQSTGVGDVTEEATSEPELVETQEDDNEEQLVLETQDDGQMGRAASDEVPLESDEQDAATIAAESDSYQLQTQSTAAASTGPNLTAAKSKYRLQNATVYEATSAAELTTYLSRAKSAASATNPAIVHVPAGTYSVNRVTIPLNVFLVAENGAVFNFSPDGDNTNSMFVVNGVLYGGTYDGKKTVRNVLYFGKYNFETVGGVNGIVDKATVKNAKCQGILAKESTCQNAQVIDSNASSCVENGICVLQDSSFKLISGCNSSNNTYSGINISHSDVKKIENCVLSNNGDKGISTNSDPVSGYKQPGCTIGSITGCTIEGNQTNGVYIKPNCYVNGFANNTLNGNNDGLICNGKTAAGTKGTSWVKNVTGNVFKNSENANVAAQWSGATIEVGNNNTITGGKSNSVVALDGGCVKLMGTGIVISGAARAGISSTGSGSSVIISGNGVTIESNATQGIYCKAGTVTVSGAGVKVTGNKKMGAGIYAKGTLNITGKSVNVSSNVSDGIYATGSSTITVSGANANISKNKKCGINVSAKVKLTISGASAKIQSNSSDGIYAAGSSKVTLKGKKLSVMSNKGNGINATTSSNVTMTGANANIAKNKKNGVTLTKKAKVTVKGKKCTIKSNGAYGMYANSKAKATIKGVKFSGNKKGATAGVKTKK